MIFKYTAAWFSMMLLAILNGAFREAFLKERYGELRAHQLSTLTLLLLLSVYVWILVRTWTPESPGQAWRIGLVWLAIPRLGIPRLSPGRKALPRDLQNRVVASRQSREVALFVGASGSRRGGSTDACV